MDRKNIKMNSVERSKSQKGKKKLGASTSMPKRTSGPKRVKAEDIPNSSDSLSSVETDEDYAEFLKTYNPQESSDSDKTGEDYAEFLKTYVPEESFPYESGSGEEEEGSRVTVDSPKKTSNSLRRRIPNEGLLSPAKTMDHQNSLAELDRRGNIMP
ncbi:hypothetical protein QL285_087505 [Trifolium repens]|nr:hypothetical protein QL285_087505 [Trifolium repens]